MKTYNIKETAARIRDLRVSFGYTQESAAEHIGIERSFLSRVETGANGCSIDILVRFAELYHVPLDYLIFGKSSQNTDARNTIDTVIQQLTALRNQM